MAEPSPSRQAIEEHVMRSLGHIVLATKSRMGYDFTAAATDLEEPVANTDDAKILLGQAVSLTTVYAQNTGHDVNTHAEMANRALHIALRSNGIIPKREM